MSFLKQDDIQLSMLAWKLIFIVLFGLGSPRSYAAAKSILSPHVYAWSDQSGYINFQHATVDDNVVGGHAWSANAGWINFQPAQGGVVNDGMGHLSGFAWGERLGWIDFRGVRIDANGKFFGAATGTLIGTLTFDCPTFCDVQTDWRPNVQTVIAAVNAGQGGAEGGGGGLSSNPTAGTETSALEPSVPERDGTPRFTRLLSVDVVQDGVINVLDFNALMIAWETSANGNRADINGDATVDIFDFNELMVYWGSTYTL